MPCAMILWNIALLAYSSSRCAGFTSPDITANSSMSSGVSVCERLADLAELDLVEGAVLDEDLVVAHA